MSEMKEAFWIKIPQIYIRAGVRLCC